MGTSLPATRYWITQLGRTEQMWQSQMSAIDQGKADFVIDFGAESAEMRARILSAGYRYFDTFYGGRVYAQSEEIRPIAAEHFSAWDIVKKRNYREAYFAANGK